MLGRLFNLNPVLTQADAREYVQALYRILLSREPDEAGLMSHVNVLMAGHKTVGQILIEFSSSEEFKLKSMSGTPLEALHEARVQMVRQLPAAKRIVDLGGGADNQPEGALVVMGYPHNFDTLTIVEPPASGRHEIYQEVPNDLTEVPTPQGLVKYIYTSMSDLSTIESGSIDLVFSGESIEHVSYDECIKTLAEVRRILAPTGFFCFDTPNRALTKLQLPNSYINPDHKYEYTHQEMTRLLTNAKLAIIEEKGISWMPDSARTHNFRITEMMMNVGMYDKIEQCYLLYYKCRAV